LETITSGKLLLKKLTLHTNFTIAVRPRMVDGKKIPVSLTPEEEEWNRKISLVRGKIEALYGWVKRVFLILFDCLDSNNE
jgi:hypothetical protein